MKYMYPAVFEREEGVVQVSVPDLPGCFTFGDTSEDAIEMAWDAASMWLALAEDKHEEIPVPSPLDKYKAKNGFVNYIVADTDEYRMLNDNKAVKKTLTIPNWLNRKAEEAGVNFSQVLQSALMSLLNVNRKVER